jgi:MFS family permease
MRVQSATHNLSLTSGSFLLFFGKLADMFGRRSMFLASLFLFAAFALGTGFSQDALTLIILNGVMGLMCALAVPPCQGILGSSHPGERTLPLPASVQEIHWVLSLVPFSRVSQHNFSAGAHHFGFLQSST